MNVVKLDQVVKRYGNHLSVDHLSLTIGEGEIFGLLGPNGAGKSTTIKMICGLLKSDHGDILVDGQEVRKHPVAVKRKIGLVPQEIAIYDELSAQENVLFFGRLYGLRGKQLRERAEEALAFVGLSERMKKKPSTFSGGMKRRLNIACALVHQPKLIIMDEPTVGIDPQSRNHILDSVRELNRRGATVIYTSHYMEEVEAISSRIGIMDHGRLIAQGSMAELMERVEEEEKLLIETADLTDSATEEISSHPMVQRISQEGDTLEVFMRHAQAHLQDILYILGKHQVRVASLQSVMPNLETLFLSLTGRTLRD